MDDSSAAGQTYYIKKKKTTENIHNKLFVNKSNLQGLQHFSFGGLIQVIHIVSLQTKIVWEGGR